MTYRTAHQLTGFYPRPPRGGRHPAQCVMSPVTPFLSTPPARGATVFTLLAPGERSVSIHAPRAGGDWCVLFYAWR